MPKNKVSFFKRLLRWRLLFVVNIVIIALLGVSLSKELVRNHEIQRQIDGLQAQADELTVSNFAIAELHTAVQTKSYIEREARLKLGMKKPGETFVIIRDDDGEEVTSEGIDPNDPLNLILDGDERNEIQLANPAKWWYYFFDKNFLETTL